MGVEMSGSVPCPSCGRAVPPGRLACPACGTLVASVRTAAAAPVHAPVAPAVPGPEADGPPEAEGLPESAAAPELRSADLPGPILPGAYLPPSSSTSPAVAGPGTGAAAGGLAGLPATGAPSQRPPAPPAGPPATPGRASVLADLPFDAPNELEGWLVALGGGIAILGFILPWRSSYEGGLQGYFDSWGLGIAAHLPIFGSVLVVAALAVLPNRIATWVRTGVCGMVAGGILLGLVWLYLGGGAEIGAILAAVGGIVMIAGGVLGVAPDRSARPPGDG